MQKPLVLLILCAIFAGCSFAPSTGDTKNDATAAQQFVPQIQGFNSTDADSLRTALTSVAGGASLLSGNPVLAAAVAKIDGMVQCYQSVGAVTARIYTQSSIDITNPEIPGAAALAIINDERLKDNFLACALGGGQESFSAQAAGFEPCIGSGDFNVNGETLRYLYAATKPEICTTFETHFNAIRAANPQQ